MILQLIFVAGLVLLHAVAGKIFFPRKVRRSASLSFAGGISVAYVFILIFPELVEAHESLGDYGIFQHIEHHAYFVAMMGLATFYGLERMVKGEQQKRDNEDSKDRQGNGIFWVHIGSFSLYNALIGYLLVYRESTALEMTFFFFAMAAHFLVNDHALLKHHREVYQSKGRWILSAAVFLGWAIGAFYDLNEALTNMLFAFLAGGIVLNVLKEELPEERQSRFLPFAAGAVLYSALLAFV